MIEQLGKYKIQRILGKGAMGVVYEGFDPLIERRVAIKAIEKSMLDEACAKEILERFVREAQAAGRLTHSRIISIYEYGEQGDIAYIVMEYVQGQDLKQRLDQGGTFSLNEAMRIMLQLLDALEYSHQHGVIHRDIKPSNIILTDNQQVKVADFGIAKIESSQLTLAGTMVGTPMYMPPEQIQGLNIDKRADLYSAGIIFYQLVTGVKPYNGSPMTVMYQVMHQDPTPVHLINENIPEALSAIVQKSIVKPADERFQSAQAFINAIKPILQQQSNNVQFQQPIVIPSATGEKQDTLSKTSKRELALWLGIKDSQNPEDFARYLNDYPNGDFAKSAKQHLAKIQPPPATANKKILFALSGLAVIALSTWFVFSRDKTPSPPPVTSATTSQPIPTNTTTINTPALPEKTETTPKVTIVKEKNINDKKLYENNSVADKIAAERATAEKLAAEKIAAAEHAAAEKIAAERAASERAAAEHIAQEKAATEKAAAEKIATERAAAERNAAERIANEKLSAEKHAAERIALEKAALEKTNTSKKKSTPEPGLIIPSF